MEDNQEIIENIQRSDTLKNDLIRKVVMSCSTWADKAQLAKIQDSLVVVLHDYTIGKEEVALSTEFAESNDRYIARFMAIKKLKGLSGRSLTAYKYVIGEFFRVVDKPMPTITTDDIRYFLARKRKEGITDRYADTILRYLRTFFKTMVAEDLIHRNPCLKIDKIQWKSNPEDPFTEEEMETIREACMKLSTGMQRLRAQALVEVLYSTGCRVSEVVGLNRERGAKETVVLGKGHKWRTVYFTARCVAVLNRYYDARTDDDPAMFVSVNKPFTRLEASRIEETIREIGKIAGIENVHPHRFRHTTATTALKKGMPIDQVSTLLGHEDIKTTRIYAVTDKDQVRESHKRYLG